MYLYGGRTPEALELLRERLRERFPGLRIVGGYSPPFRELTEAEEQRGDREIDSSGAAVVWVGTGQPKQEKWMLPDAPTPRGAAAGGGGRGVRLPRRPGAAGARAGCSGAGLEWVYRLSREPRRLWRRYARYNPRFVVGFARQYCAHLTRAAADRPAATARSRRGRR